jgi:dTMP kinase
MCVNAGDNEVMKRGLFVVIDGLGGSGKSTQMEMLRKRLPDAVFTKEPGGAPRAERIRSILKGEGDAALDTLSDFFLFWAARAEHMAALIKPALEEGKTVISDRFDSSTFAMQVRGDEQANLEEFFWECRKATLGGFEPDTYIILDIPPELAKDRRVSRLNRMGHPKQDDRFDERGEDYQSRVQTGYKEFAERVDGHVIDASRSLEEKHEDIWAIVEPLIR